MEVQVEMLHPHLFVHEVHVPLPAGVAGAVRRQEEVPLQGAHTTTLAQAGWGELNLVHSNLNLFNKKGDRRVDERTTLKTR